MAYNKGDVPWNKGEKIKFICGICKREYEVHPYKAKMGSKYCSLMCYQKSIDCKFGKKGKNHLQWKGGRQRMGNGYIHLLMPEHPQADKRGRVLEHRYIMEKIIGRKLLKNEVVHHINKIRDDNRPENLILFSSNGKHLSAEMKGVPKH